MMKRELNISFLQECLTYEASTGRLFWKRRPSEHFSNENVCAIWNAKYAGKMAGSPNAKKRWSTKINAVLYQNHRIAWALYYGCWPDDQIDHINGDPEDNRIVNLRIVTNAENQKNASRKKTNKSGVTGVCWHERGKVWQANIRGNGRFLYLGSFKRLEDAVAARKKAEEQYGYHPNHGRAA